MSGPNPALLPWLPLLVECLPEGEAVAVRFPLEPSHEGDRRSPRARVAATELGVSVRQLGRLREAGLLRLRPWCEVLSELLSEHKEQPT